MNKILEEIKQKTYKPFQFPAQFPHGITSKGEPKLINKGSKTKSVIKIKPQLSSEEQSLDNESPKFILNSKAI
jgi:hypothetical protein